MSLACTVLALAAGRAQAQVSEPPGSGGTITAPIAAPHAAEPVATPNAMPWRSIAYMLQPRLWSFGPAAPLGMWSAEGSFRAVKAGSFWQLLRVSVR